MDTNGFLNLSNRCPELQNILDSSFGFRFKWGTYTSNLGIEFFCKHKRAANTLC